MQTTDQILLERADETTRQLNDHDQRLSKLETGTDPMPEPTPDPKKRKLELYLGGLHNPDEIVMAHENGWQWGFGADAVSSLETAIAFVEQAEKFHKTVHLIIAKLTDQELDELIEHRAFKDTVKSIEVEPLHGSGRDDRSWTEVRWVRFRDLMIERGHPDKLYANKLTYDPNESHHIPASSRWPARSRNYYPLSAQDRQYFPNLPATDTFAVASNAGIAELAKWVALDKTHRAHLVAQIGREPWTGTFSDKMTRPWLAPTVDHLHYWLLQADHYGLDGITFWSARVQASNGNIDYLWDFTKSGIPDSQVSRWRRHWLELLSLLEDWSNERLPLIRPQQFDAPLMKVG